MQYVLFTHFLLHINKSFEFRVNCERAVSTHGDQEKKIRVAG